MKPRKTKLPRREVPKLLVGILLLLTVAFPAGAHWTAAPDDFANIVGSSSVDIRLQGKYSLDFGEEPR